MKHNKLTAVIGLVMSSTILIGCSCISNAADKGDSILNDFESSLVRNESSQNTIQENSNHNSNLQDSHLQNSLLQDSNLNDSHLYDSAPENNLQNSTDSILGNDNSSQVNNH